MLVGWSRDVVRLNRISSEIEAQVLEAWFNAVPRDTIASNFRISGSTVSSITSSLPPCLRAQRELSLQLKKLHMTPMDALQGINFMQQLVEQGVTPDQFSIYIGAVKKTSEEAGYKPQEVIQAAMKLTELETQSGKKYPEATKALEASILQGKEIDKKTKKRQHEAESAAARSTCLRTKSKKTNCERSNHYRKPT